MRRPLARSLATWLHEWRPGTWPLDWGEVFGRRAPLALEIGFGNGEFLVAEAQEHPERDHVGIELSWRALARLVARLERVDLPNARALLVDAEAALTHLFGPESLDQVFVNHPCPWPKARHHRRRLLDEAGLALLADRMRTGARLSVVTDHRGYAEWLAEVLEAQEALASCHPTTLAPEPRARRTTKYQRKALARGERIHFFEWYKVRPPAAAPPPPRERPGEAMPSLLLRGPLAGDPLEGFEPQTFRQTREGSELVVRLAGAYRRVGQEAQVGLVEALVQEDRLKQELFLLVLRRAPDELLVKPAEHGPWHPTEGVKRAVALLGDWLQERHPELAVAHGTLGRRF